MSLYWAFTTLSTVGYGDVLPITWQEMAWASFCQVLGATTYAFLTGFLILGANNFDRDKSEVRKVLRELDRYSKEHNLPTHIRKELSDFSNMVRQYGIELLEKHSMVPETILESLPPSLSLEICLYNNQKMVDAVKYLRSLRDSPVFPDTRHAGQPSVSEEALSCLGFLVKELAYTNLSEGSCVCKQGLPAVAMYFLASGSVHMFVHEQDSSQGEGKGSFQTLLGYQKNIRIERAEKLRKLEDEELELKLEPGELTSQLGLLKPLSKTSMQLYTNLFDLNGKNQQHQQVVVDGEDDDAFFGLLDLIESDQISGARSFTSVTLEPCVFYQLNKSVVRALGEHYPSQMDEMLFLTREKSLFKNKTAMRMASNNNNKKKDMDSASAAQGLQLKRVGSTTSMEIHTGNLSGRVEAIENLQEILLSKVFQIADALNVPGS